MPRRPAPGAAVLVGTRLERFALETCFAAQPAALGTTARGDSRTTG
jgi:hypothetical protein